MDKKAYAVSVSTLLAAVTITTMLTATALLVSCTKKEAAKSVALTVNGQAITVDEVDEAAEFFQRQQTFLSPTQLFESGGNAGVRRAAARQLAANMLLLAEVKRLGWRADSARIETAAGRFTAQFPDRETFLSQLAAMGESEESMRRGIEEEFLLDSLLNTVGAAAVPVSDEECRVHYDANAERYMEPEGARASHIVFELEQNASDSQVRAAMDKAKVALSRAKGGADFDALIKEYSPVAGGDIGWFKRGDFLPDLEHKVFSMKKGEISDFIPSGMGLHIIKKTDERAPRKLGYTEAEAAIRAGLSERKKAERVNVYVDSLIGAANVKYIDTTLAI
ncbi:MAG: peptidylprolyl isomerase [Chitinispirillales bacterium]|jgi:parvulin-like peptidyl-prolyl isomerase|nr:peptidylprolyl isomerase [Chitinispirillales bacterium]